MLVKQESTTHVLMVFTTNLRQELGMAYYCFNSIILPRIVVWICRGPWILWCLFQDARLQLEARSVDCRTAFGQRATGSWPAISPLLFLVNSHCWQATCAFVGGIAIVFVSTLIFACDSFSCWWNRFFVPHLRSLHPNGFPDCLGHIPPPTISSYDLRLFQAT